MTEPGRPPTGGEAAVPLGWSLREPFVPGTNLRGATTGGTLAFALPSLAIGRIACIGEPVAGTRTMLDRLADAVTPLAPDESSAPDAVPADVLWISGPDGAAHVGALTGSAAEALLARTPSIVVEDASGDAGSALEARLRAAGRQVAELDTLVIDGEVRAAGPRVGASGHPDHPVLPGVRRPAARWSLRGRSEGSRSGRALLAAQEDPHDPPGWIVRLAADRGHDVRGYRWSIAAPGVYDSQKVLVYLTPPGGAAPVWIVKVTRDARHAERLQNEARGLAFLAGLGPIGGLTVPGLVGSGEAGRLAAVIETIVPGRPFESLLRGPDAAARLVPAFEGLGGLAERSAHPVPASSVATTLGRLSDQYVAIHAPSAEDRSRLAGLVERVAAWPDPIDLVAMHGDPGTWNMLAAEDGRVGLLDWESFEPDGLPLWDLFYLVHAALLILGRSRIPRRRMGILSEHVFGSGRHSDLLLDAVRAYRDRLGIAPELVEPLFTFCWIHRALKESARRKPDAVADGHYARFARRIIASPTSPTLRRLYGEGASA